MFVIESDEDHYTFRSQLKTFHGLHKKKAINIYLFNLQTIF